MIANHQQSAANTVQRFDNPKQWDPTIWVDNLWHMPQNMKLCNLTVQLNKLKCVTSHIPDSRFTVLTETFERRQAMHN